VDQQATRRQGIQSGATFYPSCPKGSQGVTPFLKVTASRTTGLRDEGSHTLGQGLRLDPFGVDHRYKRA
jgi:hypothetical protein